MRELFHEMTSTGPLGGAGAALVFVGLLLWHLSRVYRGVFEHRVMKVVFALLFMGMLYGCSAQETVSLHIVIPDDFEGFGAPFQPIDALNLPRRPPIVTKSEITLYCSSTGAVPFDEYRARIARRRFVLTVLTESGKIIPLNAGAGDGIDGVRCWLLPIPVSRAFYFFVGTNEQANLFLKKKSTEIFDSHFSVDEYFQGLMRQRRN